MKLIKPKELKEWKRIRNSKYYQIYKSGIKYIKISENRNFYFIDYWIKRNKRVNMIATIIAKPKTQLRAKLKKIITKEFILIPV